MQKTSHSLMLEGEPLDPFAMPSYQKTMTPSSSSSGSPATDSPNESLISPLDLSSPVHSSFRDLPDHFKEDYQAFRIHSPQADITQNAPLAIPAIFEAIGSYFMLALSGERKFSRISLTDSSNNDEDEKKIEEFNVENELDYWLTELDNTYSHLSAHPDIQLKLVNQAIAKFESLYVHKKTLPKSGSPQFFQKIDPNQLQSIGIIIERQRTIWALRQPHTPCCSCIIL